MAKVARPLAERFWEKAIPEPNSGCWLWLGAVNANGYASLTIGSRTDGSRKTGVTASRIAFELSKGQIPAGLEILHSCDNPLCVNPDHLSAGTHQKNMQEAADRRITYLRGTKKPNAKLTEEQVLAIRVSNETYAAQAKRLGVRYQTIRAAKCGKTWRHING